MISQLELHILRAQETARTAARLSLCAAIVAAGGWWHSARQFDALRARHDSTMAELRLLGYFSQTIATQFPAMPK